MQPLISVIIPVFNRIDIFKKSLASVISQSYKNLEIVIIDDGSDPALRFDELDLGNFDKDKIKFKKQENRGAPAARNRGFKLSTGQFVIFFDADIFAQPDMIEKMYQTLNNANASFVYSNHVLGRKKFPAKKYNYQELKKMNYIPSTSLMRREDFLGFDQSLKRFQDWDLWLRIAKQGKKGIWLDQYLYKTPQGGTISSWLPSFAYKKPWKYFPMVSKKVKKYEEARSIIKKKHGFD